MPPEFRQPRLRPPVVSGRREEILLLLADKRTGVSPQKLDAIFFEPTLHLGERVAVLLGMTILVAQPGFAPGWLILPIVQYRIERNPSIAGQPGDEPAQTEPNPREYVVDAPHKRSGRRSPVSA